MASVVSIGMPCNDQTEKTTLQIAQLIQHEDEQFDAVAGTYQPTPVYFGRPKWPKVFQRIRKDNPGSKVTLFPLVKDVQSVWILRNQAS
jgi:hypothetical protein